MRMGAVIFPNNAGYYSATECRIMGPRAAEAVIDPQYADIILQRNAE